MLNPGPDIQCAQWDSTYFGGVGCNFYDMIVDARILFSSKHYYVKNAVNKLLPMFSFVTNQIVSYVHAFIIVI